MSFEPRPVTVLVLAWNGLDVTKKCLDSLLRETKHPDFKVMLVDNGSTDGTPEYVRSLDGVELLENGENLGFVGGNNAGIKATTTDVVLLNNDTEIIQGDWLLLMQELAYSEDDIGVVGCRLVNDEGRLVHAGTYMPVPSFWGQEYPGDEKDIGQYRDDREVEGVIAACVYIKRELIDKIGGLDTAYFSYYEDTDYCIRARESGYRVFCSKATVMHLENASTAVNRMDFSGTFRKSRETFMGKWKTAIESRYTSMLTWRSFISGENDFAWASEKLLWALDEAGVEANLAFLEGADRAELTDFRVNDMKNRGSDRDRPQVMFGPPSRAADADGRKNVAWVATPYETFKPEWVKELNRLDEVWVPSAFQREAALASGVKTKIELMPFGVDPEYFNPGITGYPLSDRFTFIAFVDWGAGSAHKALLNAYTQEFSGKDKVVLLVVAKQIEPGGEAEEEVEAMNLGMDRAPVVFVVDHEVPHYQYGCLYRSADCLLIAGRDADNDHRALEALACGVPVVAPAWGSMLDLVRDTAVSGYDCDTIVSPEGLNWAEPSAGSLRAALRAAVDDAEGRRAAALLMGEQVRSQRSWKALASKMVARLDVLR